MTAIHVLPLATADASLEMVGHTESFSSCGVGCLRDHAQSCPCDHRDRGCRGGERFFAPTECDVGPHPRVGQPVAKTTPPGDTVVMAPDGARPGHPGVRRPYFGMISPNWYPELV